LSLCDFTVLFEHVVGCEGGPRLAPLTRKACSTRSGPRHMPFMSLNCIKFNRDVLCRIH
jgi:hypothetical protein